MNSITTEIRLLIVTILIKWSWLITPRHSEEGVIILAGLYEILERLQRHEDIGSYHHL